MPPDDIGGALQLLVADSELAGDATISWLALEERIPALAPTLERGRKLQRQWVQQVFPSVLAD